MGGRKRKGGVCEGGVWEGGREREECVREGGRSV